MIKNILKHQLQIIAGGECSCATDMKQTYGPGYLSSGGFGEIYSPEGVRKAQVPDCKAWCCGESLGTYYSISDQPWRCCATNNIFSLVSDCGPPPNPWASLIPKEE